jgi:hypothetical protein
VQWALEGGGGTRGLYCIRDGARGGGCGEVVGVA